MTDRDPKDRTDLRLLPSRDAPGGPALRLFPGCDPRGVLSRALAPDAQPWSTRPDALVFGWMLALAPGVDSREAAASVVAVAEADRLRPWTADQRRLLDAVKAVRDDPAG